MIGEGNLVVHSHCGQSVPFCQGIHDLVRVGCHASCAWDTASEMGQFVTRRGCGLNPGSTMLRPPANQLFNSHNTDLLPVRYEVIWSACDKYVSYISLHPTRIIFLGRPPFWVLLCLVSAYSLHQKTLLDRDFWHAPRRLSIRGHE